MKSVARGTLALVTLVLWISSSVKAEWLEWGGPNGNFVAVYNDNASSPFLKDVVFRIFDQDGNLVRDEVVVDTAASSSVRKPSVGVLTDGTIAVAYHDQTGMNSDPHL